MHAPVIHPDCSVGKAADSFKIMGHKKNRHALLLHLLHAPHAALLEKYVAD